MSREVLVGETVHGLHGGDCTAAIGRHAGPCVTADVLQARHRLAGWSGAGIHAGLPLGRLCPVRGTQALLLGVAGAVEGVLLAGGSLHVRLLIGVLGAGTFFIFPLGTVVNLAVLLGQRVWVRRGQKVLGGARDTILTLVLGP